MKQILSSNSRHFSTCEDDQHLFHTIFVLRNHMSPHSRNLHHRRTPHARPPGHHGLYVSPPGHQPSHHHTRQGSVSSTSTSSGSLGSSGFVSPNRDGVERRRPVRGLGLSSNSPVITRTHYPGHSGHSLQFPSSNSAFRRPKPCTDRRKELEIYASQWQNWGNRR